MQYIFSKIKILFIATMACFCFEMLYGRLIQETYLLADTHFPHAISKDIKQQQASQIMNKDNHDIIFKRSLFKSEIEEKISGPNKETEKIDPEKFEPATLKLILRGTVVGLPEVYAVIENKNTHHQSLYEVGDSIQDAIIKNVLRRKVILTYQGKDQILEMEDKRKDQILERQDKSKDQILERQDKSKDQIFEVGENSKNISALRMLARKTELEKAPVSKALIKILSDNINELMTQARFRPHLKDGQRDGLMIYGIRPDSEFSHVGFRNGDIIKYFNGIAITSSEDIIGFFSEMMKTDNAKIILSRRGKIKEWIFQVDKNGALLKSERD
jgi:general secretion pathway protein C